MFNKVYFFIGKSIRETGQALDRLGCRVQGNYAFKERLCRHQRLMPIFNKHPNVQETTFVAPSASVIGEVEVGDKSSIWYGAVLRGDVNTIKIGDRTSIGDRVVVHVARHNPKGPLPTVVGNDVVVEDGAVLHACVVEDGSFIGAGAILFDGSHVEKNGFVEAGSVLTSGKRVKSKEVWAGNPARKVRDASEEEVGRMTQTAERLSGLGDKHRLEHAKTDLQRDTERMMQGISTDKPPHLQDKPHH